LGVFFFGEKDISGPVKGRRQNSARVITVIQECDVKVVLLIVWWKENYPTRPAVPSAVAYWPMRRE
jgi:hypothetical protein